jgi:DNA-binding XRE family transcriptional regulator
LDIIELCRAVDAATPAESLPPVPLRRKLRESAGIPLQTAATAVGISIPTLCTYELGKREPRLVSSHRYRKFLAACVAVGSTK